MSKPLFNAEESLKQSENIGSQPSKPLYNRMILVGAPDWVSGTIARLHSAGIAHVRDWSRLVPTQHPGEVMSLLQRLRCISD
ncbi:hypothetical protein [Leptolyngbya sp. O-77]|uniref:hypothetical protein n=1 Tax=Leptolyngbya sp. O-77 TaxID=1080068 RepID=UPI00074D39C5|nr:hypothetical protein [Leptolyngbya sp. O-77]BAU40385.1 hypothetical protein O77CONTIG1_00182 [Leptolyngbya sp. O-77]